MRPDGGATSSALPRHVCFMSPASPPVFFTLPTAVTHPEREGSDKPGSAVIGRLADDTADRRRGRESCSILNEKRSTWRHLARRTASSPTRISGPEMTLGRLLRENNGLVLLRRLKRALMRPIKGKHDTALRPPSKETNFSLVDLDAVKL